MQSTTVMRHAAFEGRQNCRGLANRSMATRTATRWSHRARSAAVRAARDGNGARADVNELDIEDEVERFMKEQAAMESGSEALVSGLQKAVGTDVVDDEAAKAYCREIVAVLQKLRSKRDMTLAECKLIIAIEDPRAKENRRMGIEDESGVSRDEMAAALMDVSEGRIPKDRIALKCLYQEMMNWPFLETDAPQKESQPLTD